MKLQCGLCLVPSPLRGASVVCAALVALSAACKTDKPKDVDAGGASDAGAVVMDAGAPLLDAGPQTTDAGAAQEADAGAQEPDVKPLGTNGGEKLRPAGTFDRILAKPKNQSFDVDTVRAEVEKKTGLKITQARKSARKWIFLQFAPTAKGRDAADQKKLIQQLESTGLFEVVEGDRLMKIKTP